MGRWQGARLQERPQVYVQWLRPTAGHDGQRPRYVVDTTLSLPYDRRQSWIYQVRLVCVGESWAASLTGTRSGFITNTELVYELGRPGEAVFMADRDAPPITRRPCS
jgi:hypothetical protein